VPIRYAGRFRRHSQLRADIPRGYWVKFSLRRSWKIRFILLASVSLSVLAFENCGQIQAHAPDTGQATKASSVPDGSICQVPWGGPMVGGAQITAYTSYQVSAGQTCASVAENRVCTNGVLSGTAQYLNCSVGATAGTVPSVAPTSGPTAPSVGIAGTPAQANKAYLDYFATEYQSIFGAPPGEAQNTYFLNLYLAGQIGCYATVRDLLKADPLRAQAAASLSSQANHDYIYKLYLVNLRRANLPGDDPNGLIKMRAAGTNLDDIDAIFLKHPEFTAICSAAGLRLLTN
jgi:hypothetical protein